MLFPFCSREDFDIIGIATATSALPRIAWGFSGSQRPDTTALEQISLFNETAPADQRLPEPETEEITYKRKKQKGKREQDLSGLPAERIEHELSPEERICPECGDVMKDIGVHIRRSLKLIPAKIIVVEDATHTYACEPCGKTGDPRRWLQLRLRRR